MAEASTPGQQGWSSQAELRGRSAKGPALRTVSATGHLAEPRGSGHLARASSSGGQ